MKTKELIQLLQNADPNNECDVCIDSNPIIDVSRMPSWYDGRLVYLEKNENNEIIKTGFKSGCDKIKILSCSLEEILLDNPDIEVDLRCVKKHKKYVDYVNNCIKNAQIYKEWSKDISGLPNKLWSNLNIEDIKSHADLECVGLNDVFYILLKIVKEQENKTNNVNKQTLFSRIKNCFTRGK